MQTGCIKINKNKQHVFLYSSPLSPPSPPSSLCNDLRSSLFLFVSRHRWRHVSSEPVSVKIISYIFIRVSLMWADSWGHSDSSPKGSLWSVTGNSPTPSSVYIQQSDPMLQNRARRHHNGSCGCWFQFSSLQVTNMCLCRSVNEAKQQSDEDKLVESFWVFC